MVRRFNGDVAVLWAKVAKICPGITPDHVRPLLWAFEAYAGAVLDFTVLRYVQVQRGEYHSEED